MSLGASDKWKAAYKWLTRLQVASAGALSITSICSEYAIPQGASGIGYDLILFVKSNKIWTIALANGVLWVAHVVKEYIGNPWAWDSVKALLDEFRAEVFKDFPQATVNRDRVTLFKKKERRFRWFCVPSSDWLCAVERTGHMNRRKRKYFRANDDGLLFEGVAGATWCYGVTTLKDNLPDLADGGRDQEITAYAKEAFVTVDYVKKQLKRKANLPRMLCGIKVEVDNKPWGVMVIDSQFERLATKEVIEGFYKKNANVLGKLLRVL